jgi:TonB-dependent receptor
MMRLKSFLLNSAIAALALAGAVAQAGVVQGTLSVENGGRPLVGANISVAGRQESAVTAADGSFRLDLPPGPYQLVIRERGFASKTLPVTVPAEGSVSLALTLASQGAEEVIITGTRDRSTSSEIAADNTTTVLSAEDLARNPDSSVAEALSRIPGINVMNLGTQNTNSVAGDSAARGVGTYISVRGMNSEYNLNLVNGVAVAEGEPYSREVNLSVLPPSGLKNIVVNKTWGADSDGDAIGGIVDFRLPSAFDFDQPYRASVTAAGRLETRALDYGRDGLGDNFAADASGKFGRGDQFGIYLGGYYDRRNFSNSYDDSIYPAQINGEWAYALTDTNGHNPVGMNPLNNLLLLGTDVALSTGYTERYGFDSSFDWRPDDDSSAFLKMTYSHAHTEQNTYIDQIYAQGSNTGSNGGIAIGNGLYQSQISNVQPRFYYETNPENDELGTLLLGGEKKFAALTLDPSLFFSWGNNDRPNHIELSARNHEVAPGIIYSGGQLFTYSNNFAQPLLTPSQIANAIAPVANFGARRSGEETEEFSSQVKGGFKLDGKYDLALGPLQDIKLGVKYSDSFRQHTERDWTTNKLFTTDANDPTFGSLGILSGSVSSIYPGQYAYPIPLINQKALFNLYNSYLAQQPGAFDTCDSIYVNNFNCNTQRATEAVTAAYVSADVSVGDVTFIPGFRFEHTDIKNTFWTIPHDTSGNDLPGYFSTSSTTYDEPLPSLQVNWRPDGATVYRASIVQSYERPAFFQLGGGAQISVNADGSTTETKGNPNLKPIIATNYDLSGEWSNSVGGAASLAGFYKHIGDYIYDNNAQNNFVNAVSTQQGLVEIVQPTNGGSGHVYGVEMSFRQKFQNMPAPIDGLGISGNVTWEQSAVMVIGSQQRAQNQPNWTANASLFYEKDGYHADLSYRYIDSYITNYGVLDGTVATNEWIQPTQQVNISFGYDFPIGVKTNFSVQNVTNERSFFATIGKNPGAISDIVDTGRVLFLTTTYSY